VWHCLKQEEWFCRADLFNKTMAGMAVRENGSPLMFSAAALSY